MPRYFVNSKYPEAKCFPFLATDGLLKKKKKKKRKKKGRNTQPSVVSIKDASLQRSMLAGSQNYTQLKQTNKTGYVS